jgi:RND superfamily putative drug exporter
MREQARLADHACMPALTAFVLRHKRLVVLAWLLLTLAGAATLSSTTNRLSASFSLPGQPGYVTDTKITALYHNGGDTSPIVLSATAPEAAPGNAAVADRVFVAASRAVYPGSRVADEANTGDARFATRDGRTSFGLLFTRPQSGFGTDRSPQLERASQAAAPPGWHTAVTGLAQLEGGGSSKGTSALTEAMLGGVGALAVLVFVFASFIALLPLLMALVAIPTTFLLVGGLTRLTSVSVIVEFLVALIGLGVAIDYSLLVVTRWREQRALGAGSEAAVTEAMASAGRAVVFSGLTVAVSLLAIVVLPVPFLANIGVAGFLIPIVSVAAAVTLLPVLLATIGPALDHPRLRREVHASRPWTAWARFVLRHRKAAAVAGAAVLVGLIVPLLSLRLGEPTSNALAQRGSAHAALAALEEGGVPSGVIDPIEVLVRAGHAQAVASRLSGVPGVYASVAPAGPSFSRHGTALVEVLPVAEASTPAGGRTISAVRAVAGRLPGVVGVGGTGPTQVDFVHAVYGSFPLMLVLIGVATLLLLSRAFRSIVLAAKAVVFNLASMAAAYGIMVLVWQEGHGSQALWSIPATGSITVWVPIMVFAFLFGLSMDYEVFILSRIREEYDATGSTDQAVVTGIGRTGRLVTSAALILFLGFVSLSTSSMTDLKVMATGLGAGILLDAFVVRSLLVPALVGVLGRWNWYLPAWLGRALRVRPGRAPLEVAAAVQPERAVLVGAGRDR